MNPSHTQSGYRLRCEWGLAGARAIADARAVGVVVDVLSFTTSVTVAVERGITVYPFAWRDQRAADFAAEREAVLAVGRSQAASGPVSVSLSPVTIARSRGIRRLVLPSPNGSAISAAIADTGVVVAASLRNADAVADALAAHLADGGVVAVIPAGERWPDGSLRPAAEDLWGAGAVIAGLIRRTGVEPSPEARLAATTYDGVAGRLSAELLASASGRELVAGGYRGDVELAGQVNVSEVVPRLRGGGFSAAADAGSGAGVGDA